MQDNGTAKVKNNREIYARKKIAAYALCLHYSALTLQYFRTGSLEEDYIGQTEPICKG